MTETDYIEQIKNDFYVIRYFSEDLRTYTIPTLQNYPISVEKWHQVFKQFRMKNIEFSMYEINSRQKTGLWFTVDIQGVPFVYKVDSLNRLLNGTAYFFESKKPEPMNSEKFLTHLIAKAHINNFPDTDLEVAHSLFEVYIKKQILKPIEEIFYKKMLPTRIETEQLFSDKKGIQLVVEFPFMKELVRFNFESPIRFHMEYADTKILKRLVLFEKISRDIEKELAKEKIFIENERLMLITHRFACDLVLAEYKKTKAFRVKNAFQKIIV